MNIIEMLASPLGAIGLGIVTSLLTSLTKKFNINPNYSVFALVLIMGSIITAFKFILTDQIQDQIVQWLVSIYAYATIFYKVIIKE